MTRRRMAFAVAALWLAVLASAVAVVRARGESRALFVELERLSAERDRLNISWGQQQIEQSLLSNPSYVEQIAAKRGRMAFPTPADVRIVAQ